MRKLKKCRCFPCVLCYVMNTSNRVTTLLLLSLFSLVLYTIWLQLETSDLQDYASFLNDTELVFVLRNKTEANSRGHGAEDKVLPPHTGTNSAPSNGTGIRFCKVYNLSQPINADFRCIDMTTTPSTKVCLYETWRDKYVSHDLLYTGRWEPHVVSDYQDVLRRDSSLGVIDIGANIGVFTLLAAAMNHKVLAVEPYTESIYRLHKAASLDGHAQRITVVQNAVSDTRDAATIRENGDNQGDTRIEMGYRPCIGSCPGQVTTILLDDLLEVLTFDRAIIKIDSQGYEHKAFQHANKLLDTVFVPYIYMEWLLMKEMYVAANHSSADKSMVETMMKSLLSRGYRPYTLGAHGARQLDPGIWFDWPFDIVWRLKPNKKEYGKLLSNHFRIWP